MNKPLVKQALPQAVAVMLSLGVTSCAFAWDAARSSDPPQPGHGGGRSSGDVYWWSGDAVAPVESGYRFRGDDTQHTGTAPRHQGAGITIDGYRFRADQRLDAPSSSGAPGTRYRFRPLD